MDDSRALPRHDRITYVGNVVAVNDGNSYDIQIGDRDYPYTALLATDPADSYQHGDQVSIVSSWGDANTWVILSEGRTHKDGAENVPANNNVGPITVSLPAGLWPQTAGYWWNNFCSLIKQQPLDFESGTQTKSETFSFAMGKVVDDGEDGLGVGTHQYTVVLKNKPPGIAFFTFTSVQADGNTYTFPSDLWPLYVFTFEPDFNTIHFRGYPQISATDWTVTYVYDPKQAIQQLPAIGAGSDSFSPRGVALYPATVGAMDQFMAALVPQYVSIGGEQLSISYAENQAAAGVSALALGTQSTFELTHLPIPGTLMNVSFWFGATAGIAASAYDLWANTTFYQDGQNISPIKYSQLVAGTTQPDVVISYQWADSDTSNTTDSFTGGQATDYSENFNNHGDGVTKTFTVAHPPINSVSFVIYLVDGVQQDDYTNDSTTFTTGTVPDQMGGALDASGDDVLISYNGTGPLQVFMCSNMVAANLYVTVNGVQDSLATFTGAQVTLSSPCSIGDDVEINYDFLQTHAVTETFTTSNAQQSVFTLANAPIQGSVSVPDGTFGALGAYPALGAFAGEVAQVLVPLISGNSVRFGFTIPPNSPFVANYKYASSTGELFQITGLNISERDITSPTGSTFVIPFVHPYDSTPARLNSGGLPDPMGNSIHWQYGGWVGQRYYYMAYDPTSNGYNVASPEGLHWRARTSGTLAGTDYTTMLWPTEQPSTCQEIAGATWTGYTGPQIGGLTQHWSSGAWAGLWAGKGLRSQNCTGITFAANYAVQVSWGPTGPNYQGPTIENPGPVGPGSYGINSNTSFPGVRIFRRNDSKIFNLVASIDVETLVAGAAGAQAVYIPPSGIIHTEPSGTYESYMMGLSGLITNNSCWPMARDVTSILVGVGWVQKEWFRDVTALTTRSTFTSYPIGALNAGFTINAINMAGITTAQLTIVCDPNYVENAFVNPDAPVLASIEDHSSIFLNGIFCQEQFQATPNWGWCDLPGLDPEFAEDNIGQIYTGGRFCEWLYFVTSASESKSPVLQHPGIPGLANNQIRASFADEDPGQYGYLNDENQASNGDVFVGDGAGNFMAAVAIPYWCRVLDTVGTEDRVITYYGYYNAGSGGGHKNITGYNGQPLISSVVNDHSPIFSGGRYPSLDLAGGAGLQSTTRSVMGSSIYAGDDCLVQGNGSEFDDVLTIDNEFYYPQSEGTLYVSWSHTVPNPAICAFGGYWKFMGELATQGQPAVDGNPVFFEAPGTRVENPLNGAVAWDIQGDARQNFVVDARTYLIKFKLVAGVLTETFRRDISYQGTPPDQTFTGGTASGGNVTATGKAFSHFLPVYRISFCGRYIFVLRQLRLPTTCNPGVSYQNFMKYSLECYLNADTEEGLVLKWTQDLYPAPDGWVLADYSDPTNITYQNTQLDSTTLAMQTGVNALGQEWAYITGGSLTGGGFSFTDSAGTEGDFDLATFTNRWRFVASVNGTDPPVFQMNFTGDPSLILGPDYSATVGMSQAGNHFAWTNDDGTTKTRDGT